MMRHMGANLRATGHAKVQTPDLPSTLGLTRNYEGEGRSVPSLYSHPEDTLSDRNDMRIGKSVGKYLSQ